MELNEYRHLNELDVYDKSYAIYSLYLTIKYLIKRVLSFIWYYL